MMTAMGRFLLVVALLLMTVSLVAPLWVHSSRTTVGPHPSKITGRLTGEFSEPPWVGSTIVLGTEEAALTADGSFSFSKFPATYALRVCCSVRYQRVYRAVTVDGHDQHLEIPIEPLLEISGQLLSPHEFKETVRIQAWMIG